MGCFYRLCSISLGNLGRVYRAPSFVAIAGPVHSSVSVRSPSQLPLPAELWLGYEPAAAQRPSDTGGWHLRVSAPRGLVESSINHERHR